uniref:hypothetical protein n=1 Tax=Aliarcobacter sp. TaxID=2321116 RepID=UPI0040478318
MPHYHVTLNQGRADSLTLEMDSKNDVLSFFNNVSTAIVSSIKQIVYSKELGINFVSRTISKEPYFSKILVTAKSKTKAKVFTLYYVKQSIKDEQILKSFQKLYIDDEIITDIYNIQKYI